MNKIKKALDLAKYNKKMFIYKIIKKIISIKVIQIFVPSKFQVRIDYYIRLEKGINFCNPITFNEKLQWLKIYDRKSEYTKMVDKYEVREYIAEIIGKEYLIPLLGVYNDFDEIDFNTLPNQFVIKCTHDSGGLIICTDKSKLDIDAVRKKINKSFKKNYYYHAREWPYKNVKSRIICEKYMVDESGTELKDYKIYCFSGEPKMIQVDYNRFSGHKRNLYDIEWNYIPASINYQTDSEVKINKPDKLEAMLELAKVLSKDYIHVRVDFYSINERIYFGEMTFYPKSGFNQFEPESLGEQMGRWIKLPFENNSNIN